MQSSANCCDHVPSYNIGQYGATANNYSHTESPKYRCPRCKIQTCSLPCYKRHQQRAACNGKRDPTSYVKKSQWATPAGIDHDYNYLKGVERTIGDAGQDAQSRGIGVTAQSTRGAAKAWHPQGGLVKYLIKNDISVDHAPLGMSRQKNNQTRLSKKGNITWTVEWVDVDSSRHLQNECTESTSVAELYTMFQATLRNATKRRGSKSGREKTTHHPPLKRRRIEKSADDTLDEQLTHLQSIASEELSSVRDFTGELVSDSLAAPGHSTTVQDEESDGEVQIITESRDETSGDGAAQASDQANDAAQTQAEVHYFLHKPGTRSKHCIFIPLDPRATLTDSLRGRTVQEYPTIYVLREPAAALPPGYMLEAQYAKTLPVAVMSGLDGPRTRAQPESEPPATIDAKSVLEMLKRNVTI